MTTPAITSEAYDSLEDAYRFFNTRLWGGTLPEPLITLQRRKGARGFFAPQRFRARPGERDLGDEIAGARGEVRSAHELALNPEAFPARLDREIVSTLVHEMTHAWQQAHGTPSRRGYHNKQWAAEMRRIGLHPSSTGEPGGRETGQRVSHYIVDGGLFATLWTELEATGFALRWESAVPSLSSRRVRAGQRASKTKYACLTCQQRAWSKPKASLLCGRCSSRAALTYLVAETGADEAVR